MKTLHLSLIIIAVIATVVIMAITFSDLQTNLEIQNQAEKLQVRIHVLTDNGTKYVKINDLAPNSAVPFAFPYTGNTTTDIEIGHRWELIRLPKDLGGDKDDISSFRAYSMVDISGGCLTMYRPGIEKLQEPCNNGEYEPVNGIAVIGRAMYQKYNALPNLDLGIDDEGYIYVKPPIFEFDKNGVIGAGRMVQ
ncbi:MAG: (2Fe-2S)-binding protein [Nitrosotalea sp.]